MRYLRRSLSAVALTLLSIPLVTVVSAAPPSRAHASPPVALTAPVVRATPALEPAPEISAVAPELAPAVYLPVGDVQAVGGCYETRADVSQARAACRSRHSAVPRDTVGRTVSRGMNRALGERSAARENRDYLSLHLAVLHLRAADTPYVRLLRLEVADAKRLLPRISRVS